MNKTILRNSLVAAFSCVMVAAEAQNNPIVISTGKWISRAQMAGRPGITDGVNGNSTDAQASQGYRDNTLTSSGTINRGCFVSPTVTIQSCNNNGGPVQFNFRLYADWNNDGQFNSSNEMIFTTNSSLTSGGTNACNSVEVEISFNVPLVAQSGDVHFRWALREGTGDATPGGGYTGEIEDYTLTLTANTAPTLNAAGTPAFNPLLETQTNNPGLQIVRLKTSTLPGVVMVSDNGTCDKGGIAITGTTGSNGAWQYKIGSAAWTAVGGRSGTNALLLDDSASLRFVPTAAGSAGITFRAWDETSGSNGASVNPSAVGGASAFSSASESASLQILAASTADNDLVAFMTAYNVPNVSKNIISALVGSPTKQFEQLTSDNQLGVGRDIVLDQLNNTIYWVGGTLNGSFMRSNTDGTNVTELQPADFYTEPSGLALAETNVFLIDNFGIWVYDADGAFVNYLTLPGAGYGNAGDLEYSGGKLYFNFQDNFAGPHALYSMNTDGTDPLVVHTYTNIPRGLDVANATFYWTEQNGATATINSMPTAGGAVTTLATGTNRIWSDLIVNTANSRIYFADMSLTNTDGYVKSIPRAGGTAADEILLDVPVTSLALYRDPVLLPVHFLSINAWVQDSRNMVEWVIAEEDNVKSYVVERSSNGSSYTEIGTVAAMNQSKYQLADGAPLTGVNIYRVKSIDIDGKASYSPNVRLVRDDQSKGVAVYPTLITNNQFTLRLQNVRSGTYQLQVINSVGQPVMMQRLNHSIGVTSSTINLPSGTARGVYRVVVTSESDKYTSNVVVQ